MSKMGTPIIRTDKIENWFADIEQAVARGDIRGDIRIVLSEEERKRCDELGIPYDTAVRFQTPPPISPLYIDLSKAAYDKPGTKYEPNGEN